MAVLAEKKGIIFIDAPVSGGKKFFLLKISTTFFYTIHGY